MRILIIALPRTGSTTLLQWIGKELNYPIYNEPYRTNQVEGIDGVDVITKWVVGDINNPNEIPIDNNWDKIILLSRENIREQAISFQRAWERNEWIDEYTLTPEWITRNENEIRKWQGIFEKDLNRLNETDGIRITYEGIYHTGEHRETLRTELGIPSWKYLDIIGIDKRYRKDIKLI